MILSFYGGQKAREKARELIEALVKKKPHANVLYMQGDSWRREDLLSVLDSESLFSGNSIVRLSEFFATRESAETVGKLLPLLSKSKNIFVFTDDRLLLDDKRLLEEHAKELKEIKDEKPKEKGDFFNIYALTDALAYKKRRELWLLYHEALNENISPEFIFWKFVWQIRILLAVPAGREGLKAIGTNVDPGKTLKKREKWEESELLLFHKRLVELYHDFDKFRGDPDLEFALERVILSV